jgi:hypothetical protein
MSVNDHYNALLTKLLPLEDVMKNIVLNSRIGFYFGSRGIFLSQPRKGWKSFSRFLKCALPQFYSLFGYTRQNFRRDHMKVRGPKEDLFCNIL